MAQSTGTRKRESKGTAAGTVRALFTLAGVAGAGALVWLASTFDLDEAGEFWAAMGLLLVAGFAVGLSQLVGGWTKWGRPTFSPRVFLIAFVPTLVVALWIVLAEQPESGWAQGTFSDWSGDLGLESLVNDIGTFVGVIPVLAGLVLAFTFDTAGPPERIVERYPERESQESVAEELRRRHAEEGVVESDEPAEVAEPSEPAPTEDEHKASLSQGT